MVDTPIDELNLRIGVKTPKQVAEPFAGDFEDLLRVACLLLEDNVP